jgi:guanyl-specific ribonuclease Sa
MRGQLVKKILLLGVAVLLAALFQGELRQLFVEPFSESKSSHLLENRELAGTLERISRGGPFPYKRDGVVFENRERLLPAQPRGYYREYTVPTPGLNHRGARRVVTGGDPPQVFFYTEDHYRSFTRIEGRGR